MLEGVLSSVQLKEELKTKAEECLKELAKDKVVNVRDIAEKAVAALKIENCA